MVMTHAGNKEEASLLLELGRPVGLTITGHEGTAELPQLSPWGRRRPSGILPLRSARPQKLRTVDGLDYDGASRHGREPGNRRQGRWHDLKPGARARRSNFRKPLSETDALRARDGDDWQPPTFGDISS